MPLPWSSRDPCPCPGVLGIHAHVLEFLGSKPMPRSSRDPCPCLGVLGIPARVPEFLGSIPMPALRIHVACTWPAFGLHSAYIWPTLYLLRIGTRLALAQIVGQPCLPLLFACIQPVLVSIRTAYSLYLACTGLNLACISPAPACCWPAFGRHFACIWPSSSGSLLPALARIRPAPGLFLFCLRLRDAFSRH
jgi:hypothetical protein